MASVAPKLKSDKPLQIQFKRPNEKCTINSLTNTLKRLIPNIKEIKITSKKLPKNMNNKKLYPEQVLRPFNVKKEQKTQAQAKPTKKEKPDNKDVEYYPDKLKRQVGSKKIVLEPRHEYKVVAATNKRKRRTPKKDAGNLKKHKKDLISPEISSNEVSFEDMIPSSIIHKIKDFKNTFYKNETDPDAENDPTTDPDLKNALKAPSDLKTKSKLALKVNKRLRKDLKSDSGPQIEGLDDLLNEVSLTDEDFMEILTCPSPVWWEDPPDANYIEESIGHFPNQNNPPQTEDCTTVLSKTTQPSENTKDNDTELNVATKSFGNKKLIEKRLKLENLLSSLKNNSGDPKKYNKKERKISSDGSELSVGGEDLIKSLQSIEIPIQESNIDKENEIINNFDEVKDDIHKSVTKADSNKSKNKKTDKTVNINQKTDTKTEIASKSPDKKQTSPRKSNRISPKKHQLTKYYNLKSKRPRIIKQNPRNKIIIETHIKTNINTQKTPEKKSNKKPNDVSKIKKAYLDLLQHSKIENNLKPKQSESSKEINEKQNNKEPIDNIEENKLKTNNIDDENTKLINEIPITLPKLTKIPKSLTVESPKSIDSVTSESTDMNSEIDTISDTNIHYIDEYDGKKDELVTVYQIISKNDAYMK